MKKVILILLFIPILANAQDVSTWETRADEGPKQEGVKVEVHEGEILDVVEEQAEYPGGMPEMYKFLSENFKFPESAEGVQGKVYAKFIVKDTGEIGEVKILKGIAGCDQCSAEVFRVLKLMPNWKPGKVNGKVVNSWFTIPFKIG